MIPLGREDKVQLDPKLKMEKDKIVFKGSHPDNLYRVVSGGGAGAGKFARVLRILRWPAALVLVCVALAVFVYFLMPDTIDSELGRGNATYWETVSAGAGAHFRKSPPGPETKSEKVKEKGTTPQPAQGTRTSEIDFYDADDLTSIIDTVTETSTNRKLPIQPVYPSHITPEVQYGNEKADSDKLRTAKILEETNSLPEDSTLKPHITQKPEKPLEIYFKDGNGITTTTLSTPETITNAETIHDYSNYGEKYTTKQVEESRKKTLVHSSAYREQSAHLPINQASPTNTIPAKQLETPIPVPVYAKEPEVPPEIQEFYQRRPTHVDVNFTSGHSKLFGISIEDAEKMRSTTQSSVYNTRVSPTLPTWRDGDDSTTKHYPVNVNYDVNGLPIVRDASGIMPYAYGYFDIVPQCRSTRLAVCRGVLPYDLAGPGAKINGVDMTVMMPQIEYLIATNCSERLQPFLCALLEPECNPPPYPAKMPCYNLCKAISDNCEGLIPVPLLPVFNCNQYSTANCVSAKTPCNSREMTCGDGSCVPRDWICDGAQDCPAGEDEAKCVVCEPTEFKCQSGGCILKRWMCDGYADCPEGEDEAEGVCEKNSNATNVRRNEPGEESAGSAPAPAVRKPYKVPNAKKNKEFTGRGENESSKELLVTSDSKSALMMRNIAARPSLSRLTPYSRPSLSDSRPKEDPTLEAQPLPKEEIKPKPEFRPKVAAVETDSKKKNQNNGDNKEQNPKTESEEEGRAIGDLGFFDEMDKEESVDRERKEEKKETLPYEAPQSQLAYAAPPSDYAAPPSDPLTRLDKSLNKLEKVIDGASLLRKAASQQDPPDSPEKTADKEEMPVSQAQQSNLASWASAHASPCPSGELRCVDGRCITLAQLCDGTIDCSDNADEDNCYT